MAWSPGREEIKSMPSLGNQGDVCGSRRCRRNNHKRQKMDARPGRQGLGRALPRVPVDSPPKLRRMKSFLTEPPTSCCLPSFLTSVSLRLSLSRSTFSAQKVGGQKRQEQCYGVSSICSLFETQITSKCSSPAERQEIAPLEATAHSRCDELVGPKAAQPAEPAKRLSLPGGESRLCEGEAGFSHPRPRPAHSLLMDSFPGVLPGVWLEQSCERPSV